MAVTCAALLLVPCPASANDGNYLSELLARAEAEQLAEKPEWRTLLHYKPLRAEKGGKSLITTESFFAAPEGRFDPKAELAATLAGFFANPEPDVNESAQCRYPARYHWLDRMLGFETTRLAPLSCSRFEQWFDEMNPHRLTLVFPSAYINNPASMFGHTLLRIDDSRQNEDIRLLAYTINYAADTSRERGLDYAFKGLFGKFPGRYAVAPYYLKVKEYGDIENRDIWEYRLNLSPEETRQMLRHLWELQSARFDYYFLDENCSYQLLALLETARPGLALTDGFAYWAYPSETVRKVMAAKLVTDVRFRPSRSTIIAARAHLLKGQLQGLARSIAEGGPEEEEMGGLTPAERAEVLDLAVDYAAYRQTSGFGRTAQTMVALPALLKARSRVDDPGRIPAIAVPEVPPGEGHKTARAALGYGSDDGRQFVEFKISPGYHELLDPVGGYMRGAQVMVMNTAGRYYPEKEQVELERLDLIDIKSLAAWSRFLQPISWSAALGIERKMVAPSNRPLLGQMNVGAGMSHDVSRATSAYVFANGAVEMSDRFDYFLAPGIGASLGVIHDVSKRWRTELSFRDRFFFLHEVRNDYEISARNRMDVTGQSVVGCDLAWKREFSNNFAEGKVYWQIYF